MLPEPRWAVEGILPEGLSILAGKPKLGKSWLAMNLALAVASGGVALGKIPVERGPVLYLALEDTKRRFQARLRKLLSRTNAAAPEGLTLATAGDWPRQDKGGAPALREWLHVYQGLRLVVIDTWAKFRTAKAAGRDEYEQDTEHASELKELADKHGLALLIVTHCTKLNAPDPIDQVRGSLGLTGAADTILVMRRERGQHDAALFVTGRDVEDSEQALQWDPQYCLWTLLGDADAYRMSAERRQVLTEIEKAGRPLRPTELALLLGKGLNATKQLVWKMEQAGLLRADSGGHYRMSDNRSNRDNPGDRQNRGDGGSCGNRPGTDDPIPD
jgi:hypothetical protein